MNNQYQYAPSIIRVKDVYGYFHWLHKPIYDDPSKILIPICNNQGLRRSHTKAGEDRQNMLHRDNILQVMQSKQIYPLPELEDNEPDEPATFLNRESRLFPKGAECQH